ncbi:hypothetical protein P3T73_15180 [Kiritimatiellota bacterium B12222]|nr:hypothetical protein P3T73_15180 [Kiritimatiellota bacterium B12222]
MKKNRSIRIFLLGLFVSVFTVSCAKHVDDPEVLKHMETKEYEVNGQQVEIRSSLPEEDVQALIQDPDVQIFITQ